MVWPFLFWSLVVVFIDLCFGRASLSSAAMDIALFPISPVAGVYWFVYVIGGLYLIIPVVSPWLRVAGRRELLFLLGLWLATLFLPYINIFSGGEIYRVGGSYYFLLIYMGGFIGYMWLGVYMRRYPIILGSRVAALVLVVLVLALGMLPILYGYFVSRGALPIVTDNLSLSSAFFVLAAFIFFQNFALPRSVERLCNLVAKYSFGIYLIHIIIIRDGVWRLMEGSRFGSPVWETPFIAVTSLLICLGIVRILSRLPKSKYIVGV